MKRLATFCYAMGAVAIATFCLAATASAQVMSYDHHSTAFGDWQGGYAEVLQAAGLNARNRAYAYRVYVAAERERESLHQERMAAYRYQAELEQKQLDEKAARNRLRQQEKAEEMEQQARYLVEDMQSRNFIWPRALRNPRYAGQRLQIESILRDWDAGYNGDRRALGLVSEELREELSLNPQIEHLARRDAVETIKQLQWLAANRDQPRQQQREVTQVASR